jgi:transposase
MRSLDHFYDLQEELQIVMHKSICENIGRSAYLVFYDVTNYYFETDIDDEDETDESGEVVEKGFRKRGPSKEHKPNPIVQMGLFMDSNGIPIAYELFEGNFVDPVTYIPAIEQVKKQFGIERIVTVADKAMNSAKNVTDAHLKGDGWLFSQKFRGQKGAPKDIQNFVLDKSGWEYNKDMSFAKKSVVKPRKLSNGEMVDQKILVTWREKYAVREKIRRDGALEYANSLRNPDKFRMTMRRGGKKYLKMILQDTKTGELVEAHPYFDIDQELADDDARFDGMNVIVTSETSMSDEEMIASYGRLNTIEDCFRVTKTDLKARPVFVWTKKHIEAHFLTCFVALTIIKILHYKLQKKYSTRRIIKALKSMKISEISNGIVELFKNETAYSLQNDLGNEICNRYYKIEDVMRM